MQGLAIVLLIALIAAALWFLRDLLGDFLLIILTPLVWLLGLGALAALGLYIISIFAVATGRGDERPSGPNGLSPNEIFQIGTVILFVAGVAFAIYKASKSK